MPRERADGLHIDLKGFSDGFRKDLELDSAASTPVQTPSGTATPSIASSTRRFFRSTAYDPHADAEVHELAPADHGFAAWRYLTVVTCLQAILWAPSNSFGIFQPYYQQELEGGLGLLNMTGTICLGLVNVLGAIAFPLVEAYARYRTVAMVIGWLLCSLALVATSFAASPMHILLFHGLMYNLGQLLLYVPSIAILSEWFTTRRGLALGIAFGGCNIGGLIAPPIFSKLLTSLGFRTTCRALGIFIFVGIGVMLPFLKARLPPSRISNLNLKTLGLARLRSPLVWILLFANFMQGGGAFLPTLYIVTQARAMQIPLAKASLLLTLYSGASFLSKIGFGALSDTFNTFDLMAASSVLGVFTVLGMWAFAANFASLAVFIGSFALGVGGFSSLWAWAAGNIAGREDLSGIAAIVGWCSTASGLGTIAGGSIAATMDTTSSVFTDYALASPAFRKLVFLTGGLLSGSAVAWAGRFASRFG